MTSMTWPSRARGRDGERGLVATEAAILLPIVLMIALLAVYVGQVNRHSSRAQSAADAAARAASLHFDQGAATAAANAAAAGVCRGSVDLSLDFDPPIEDSLIPGRAVVTLSCTESYSGFRPLIEDRDHVERAIGVATIEYWRADR